MNLSKQDSALIIIAIIISTLIGLFTYQKKHHQTIDSTTLLNAQLLTSQSNQHIQVTQHLGKLTLINFWASWCAPCRHEMPLLNGYHQQFASQGFKVIGIAIDNPQTTQAMLDSMNITYPILYAEQTGMQLMHETGNPNGLLPYSLLLNEDGDVLLRKIGEIKQQELSKWLKNHLTSSK